MHLHEYLYQASFTPHKPSWTVQTDMGDTPRPPLPPQKKEGKKKKKALSPLFTDHGSFIVKSTEKLFTNLINLSQFWFLETTPVLMPDVWTNQ